MGPDSFIPTGATTSAADPFEVSPQIRPIRRPNSGPCSVPVRREPADPFVHVANVKRDGAIHRVRNSAARFGTQEAAKPARDKSRGTSEEKERRDCSWWLRPLSPLSNQLALNVVSAYDYDYSLDFFLQLLSLLNNDYSCLNWNDGVLKACVITTSWLIKALKGLNENICVKH